MKKRINRLPSYLMSLFAVLALAFTLLPAAVHADSASVKIGDQSYDSLKEAISAAKDGDTIKLGKGTYTSYSETLDVKNKNLTFEGSGKDTIWQIGPENPKDSDADYSLDVRGSDKKETFTFKNMTLKCGNADYLGFAGMDNSVVENCILEGRTAYWGYNSATFKDCTFNCPDGNYGIWTYCSPEMTFDGCTFNTQNGKAVNVYTDYSSEKFDLTINFKNCKVNASGSAKKTVLKINDKNMKANGHKFIINISGKNSISGDVYRDGKYTCSRWFGFDKDDENCGVTQVNMYGKTVYEEGKMVAHEMDLDSDGHKYTEGYEDDAYDVSTGEWEKQENGSYHRTTTKICKYCGYTETVEEKAAPLKYEANGGDGDMTKEDQDRVDADEKVTVAENGFTKEGYTFVGWNTKEDGSGASYAEEDTLTMPDESVTLYAQWAKNVNLTYDMNGGDGSLDQVSAYAGGSITLSDASTISRDGYTFMGWNTQKDGKGESYEAGSEYTVPETDTTLYATWGGKITYNIGEASGNIVDDQFYLPGEEAVVTEVTPNLTGSSFSAWNDKEDGSGASYKSGSKIKVNGNVTLYAQWKKNYTLTYNANGGSGSMDSETKCEGSKVTLPKNEFTKTNYTFTGWNTKADGSGTGYAVGTKYVMPAKDVTLYAMWTSNSTPATKVTLTFDANGGSGSMKPQSCTKGNKITLKANSYTRTGYTFNGWNTKEDGSGTSVHDQATVTIKKDVTLYAQWKKTDSTTADKCTVSYNANGGSGSMASTQVSKGSKTTISANKFTRSGYSFTGWNTKADGSGTAVSAGATATINSDITLYAQWKKGTSTSTVTKTPSKSASSTTSSSSSTSSNAKTGDASNVVIYILLFVVAAAVAAVLVYKKNKK